MTNDHLLKTTLDAAGEGLREWLRTDALTWLHLFKTIAAVTSAMGLAMLLQLPQPRVAMTTAVVLMQPLTGMVLAKSVYRFVGTLFGATAALMLGAIFVQQPEAYMAGLTAWVAICTALAVRYRHFRWYGFVLAGYTAALIGIPGVQDPSSLLLASLNRVAEVTLGIVCSGVIGTLVLPVRVTTVLEAALHRRDHDFKAFAANVLERSVSRDAFERRIGMWVDEAVALDAQLRYAARESSEMRTRSGHLARLNSEFTDACARLHALHQLFRRLKASDNGALIDTFAVHLDALAALLRGPASIAHDTGLIAALRSLRLSIDERVQTERRQVEVDMPGALLDFDTAVELLAHLIDDLAHYARTHEAWLRDKPFALSDSVDYPHVARTPFTLVGATFVRTATVMASAGAFWIATGWPSGGSAVIAAALACGLCATSPRPSRLAWQMAIGAAASVLIGCTMMRCVYPNIDSFPLLCVALAPLVAGGTFVAARRETSGFGSGFLVFFCLLAGPDNVIDYAPETLLNNGLAAVIALFAAALCFAAILPPHAKWLVKKAERELRSQVARACEERLDGLNHRFHASTHDLMYQMRGLLEDRSRAHRRALRWMLATLEIGQAVIDLREALARMPGDDVAPRQWRTAVRMLRQEIALLFTESNETQRVRAIAAVAAALETAQQVLASSSVPHRERVEIKRIVASMHSIRTALLDRDAPFRRR